MKEYILENKKNITIVSIFILFIIILSIIVKLLGTNNKVLVNYYISRLQKEDIPLNDNTCDLDNILKYNNVPYFNLSNETFDAINEEILTETLLRICYQEGYIDYEASLNNNILSLAINISHETFDDLAYVEYKTYNIDINRDVILDNASLLSLYNITPQDVTNTVTGKLMEYYEYEKTNNLIDNISFNEYLMILNYKPITIDNMNLYVDNKNDLYIFKDYSLSEGMSITENFPDLTIKFKLT